MNIYEVSPNYHWYCVINIYIDIDIVITNGAARLLNTCTGRGMSKGATEMRLCNVECMNTMTYIVVYILRICNLDNY